MVIDIVGRLTPLDRSLREAVHRSLNAGKRDFVLRMTDVSYMDVAGLEQLISAYTSIRNMNGSIRLLAPSQRVRDLLKMTQLDTILGIVEDETGI